MGEKLTIWIDKYHLSVKSFTLVFIILAIVQLKLTDRPMIILERFIAGGGWVEITILAIYAAIVIHYMKDTSKVEKWRKHTWLVFSYIFFLQLILGILIEEKLLMTGKLHLPVPALILSGSIYRAKISFMPILFLSTIILSGPAWCSQLCYFGAFDNLAASIKKGKKTRFRKKMQLKNIFLVIIIITTILFRLLGISTYTATITAIIFGVIGVIIILTISSRTDKMTHCILYCPIGTITNYLKYISPFRMKINHTCTDCMLCSTKCRYDALNKENILNRKPGLTCTYCGECLPACKQNSIEYKFLNLHPEKARNLFLIITISIHAIFIGLGRI